MAVPRNSRVPSLDYPPIQVHRFSGDAYTAGVEHHIIDGASVSIYNPEKTLADCFKFRNKIGMNVFLKAVKLYKSRHTFNLERLLEYADVYRVKKMMAPYLEATM